MKKLNHLTKWIISLLLVCTLTTGAVTVPSFASEDLGTTSEDILEEVSDEVIMEDETSVDEDKNNSSAGPAIDDNDGVSEDATVSYTVILDANGGYFENEWDDVLGRYLEKTEILNKVISYGGMVDVIPVKEQEDGKTKFIGWSLERDGELLTQDEYVALDNCTLFALWGTGAVISRDIDDGMQNDESYESAEETENENNSSPEQTTDIDASVDDQEDVREDVDSGNLENKEEQDQKDNSPKTGLETDETTNGLVEEKVEEEIESTEAMLSSAPVSSSHMWYQYNGNIDIRGYAGNSTIQTTFSNYGYSTVLQCEGDKATLSFSQNGEAVAHTSGLTVTPYIEFTSDGSYVIVKYIVKNSSISQKTFSLGVCADVDIDSNDYASIYRTNHGLRMVDSNNGKTYYLVCKNISGLSSAGTLWFGHYSNRYDNIYNDTSNIELSGVDSGLAFSWKNQVLSAGSKSTFVYQIGIGEAGSIEDYSDDYIHTKEQVWGFNMDNLGELDYSHYLRFMGPAFSAFCYRLSDGSDGLCAGMVTSTIAVSGYDCPPASTFKISDNKYAKNLNDVKSPLVKSITAGDTAADLVKYAHAYQKHPFVCLEKLHNKNKLDKLYKAIKKSIEDHNEYIEISIRGMYEGRSAGHSLLAMEIAKDDNNTVDVLVYDGNNPNELQHFFLSKSNGVINGWSYPGKNNWFNWRSGEEFSEISYTTSGEDFVNSYCYEVQCLFEDSYNRLVSIKNDHVRAKVGNGKEEYLDSISSDSFLQISDNSAQDNRIQTDSLENDNAYYWVKPGGQLQINNFDKDNNMIVASETHSIGISCSTDSSIVTDFDGNDYPYARFDKTSKNEKYNVDFKSYSVLQDNRIKYESVKIEGISKGSSIVIEQTDTSKVVVEGTKEVKIEYDNSDESDSVNYNIITDGHNIRIEKKDDSLVVETDTDNNGTFDKIETIKTTISSAVVSVPDMTYTGKALTPTVTVKLNGNTLKKDIDYDVSYAKNTNAGTATVTINGKGIYSGTVTKTFKINAASISDASLTGISNKTYNGSAQKQNPIVKVNNKTLVNGTDYSVSYKNNVNAGTATIIIAGKGNYTGTKSATFKIVKPTTIVNQGKCGNNVSWKLDSNGKLTISGTGTIPDYLVNKYSSTAICKNEVVKTITIENGITGIGKYAFLECEALSSVIIPDSVAKIGEGAFSSCAKLVSVKLSKKLSTKYAESFMHTPWFNSIMNKQLALQIYEKLLKARQGNYCGEFCLLYISNDDIPDLFFRYAQNEYTLYINGSYIESVYVGSPSTILHFTYYPYRNFYKICEDENYPTYYTVAFIDGLVGCYECLNSISSEYANSGYYEDYISEYEGGRGYNLNLRKWIASREITKEQFDSKKANRIGGTKEKKCSFVKNTEKNVTQIVLGKKLIKTATVTGINAKTYTGKAITQNPTVKLGTTVLKHNTDYKVSYKNNINSGTATIIITGKGNYAGTINKTFKINPRSISNATVALSASKVWTGSALTPAPTVKYGSTKLKKGTHYSLVYKSNKNVGTASITITGKGNFSGTVKKTFLIIPKSTNILRLTPGTKKYTVFWKKQTSQTTGYQIQYSTRSDFKTKKTITLGEAGKTSKAVSGLAKKSKYYIRVRTYKKVGSKKYYSTWSSTKAVTTK